MCRNIRQLFNFEPPATDDEVRNAALQFVRKISGSTKPSQRNEALSIAPSMPIAASVARTGRFPGNHAAAEEPRGRSGQGARPHADPLRLTGRGIGFPPQLS